MTELSRYRFSTLRDGELTLYRGSGDGLAPILLVAPVSEQPRLESLQRLEHEYALRDDLDSDWAARPLALTHRHNRMALVLEDPGGEPLDRLLGRPLETTEFLRIAISLAAALRRLHERNLIHKDIKPANVLVDMASGGAWLTGFGITLQEWTADGKYLTYYASQLGGNILFALPLSVRSLYRMPSNLARLDDASRCAIR